ncbi:TRAP transporter small permease [Cupriavidus pauculus]|uniref:TRAP transporter small permease n=1 Tax=Cupriavidus pauculus TaxID=82633 RepID=UPI001EE38CC9|nr:TRAP transporter small permease [Cupriavidus pauculus]GJG96892.1 TRAP transporter small permease [Cupriavidus pauculus]
MTRLTLRIAHGAMVVLMIAMIGLVFGNVVLRYVFNTGIAFSEEASRFLFMWLTLLGALLVMHDRAHLGMNTVVARLGPGAQRVCRLLADAGALGCCLLLTHGAWQIVEIGMDDRAPVTGVPLGLVYACLLLCGAGMAAMLAWSLWRLVSGRMALGELVPQSGTSGE